MLMQPPSCIRLFNYGGGALARLGLRLPSLEPGHLLRIAQKRTGFSDYGDPRFREGLEKLAQELQSGAQLSQTGRIAARFNLLDNLCVRLRLLEYRKQRPEVARQVVEKPLFIVGLPRTGTTILFELLAQDPQFRTPASWEAAQPVPPPREQTYDDDPRIQASERTLAWLEKLTPGFQAIHAVGARLPQECVYLLASNFVSEQFGYMYNVPAYRDWALQQDMGASYRWHAAFLQHLQVDYSARHWLLKTPAHLAYLQYIVAQYPDARIVWTHRRPLDAIASFSSLVTRLRAAFSSAVDPRAAGAYELQHFSRIVERGMAQRSTLDEGALFDVGFRDICDAPLRVVSSIYAHFGLTLTGATESRMRAYLERHPRYRYGPHNYSPEQFGLRESSEHTLYADYLTRYARYLKR